MVASSQIFQGQTAVLHYELMRFIGGFEGLANELERSRRLPYTAGRKFQAPITTD